MSAKHAVLGLVVERPGYGYQLAQRLSARLGASAFAPSGVYAALDRLAREGLVSPAGGPEPTSGDSGRAARTTYRATHAGERRFEAWMLSSSPPPPLRDELHIKIALCRPRDVPRLVENIHGHELAARARVCELRLSGGPVPAGPGDWPAIARRLAVQTEIALWEARLQWLGIARHGLQQSHASLAAEDSSGAAAAAR